MLMAALSPSASVSATPLTTSCTGIDIVTARSSLAANFAPNCDIVIAGGIGDKGTLTNRYIAVTADVAKERVTAAVSLFR